MKHDHETKHHDGWAVTNEMRLSLKQWVMVLVIVALVAIITPWLWRHLEPFETGVDYRIPYALSNDYWLFDWRLQKTVATKPIVVLGDSVVWGEFVKSDGTLPHFLNREGGQPDRFVNAGVNGLFPLALEGLVRHYGTSLHGRKVMVVCNVLWLSSPKADLQDDKVDTLNHAALVPQFFPRIPGYQADASARLSAVIGRNSGLFGWANHLQDAYFQQRSIPQWTLKEDPDRPRCYPNSCKNPLTQITLTAPSGQSDDAARGPGSGRHQPWSARGTRKAEFEWVNLDSSLQWAAFQRTVGLLRDRGNEVMIIVAPFNAHLMADSSRGGFQAIQTGISGWLDENRVPHVMPDTLPSDLYADPSHPLTEGYETLAKRIWQTEEFQSWLQGEPGHGK